MTILTMIHLRVTEDAERWSNGRFKVLLNSIGCIYPTNVITATTECDKKKTKRQSLQGTLKTLSTPQDENYESRIRWIPQSPNENNPNDYFIWKREDARNKGFENSQMTILTMIHLRVAEDTDRTSNMRLKDKTELNRMYLPNESDHSYYS
jgi:hypothetical protein